MVRDGSLSPQHSNGSYDPLDDEPQRHDDEPLQRHDVETTPRSRFSTAAASDGSIMALLQNQQSILQQVLQGQLNLESQQTQLQKRLDEVEKWRAESQTPVSHLTAAVERGRE